MANLEWATRFDFILLRLKQGLLGLILYPDLWQMHYKFTNVLGRGGVTMFSLSFSGWGYNIFYNTEGRLPTYAHPQISSLKIMHHP